MPAYKIPLYRQRCIRCQRPANYEVYNTRNSSHGSFCSAHAKEEVTRLNKTEKKYSGDSG